MAYHILVRSSLTDDGPSHDNSSALSPDIIPIDNQKVVLSYFGETFKEYDAKPLRPGVTNNVYVRGSTLIDSASNQPTLQRTPKYHHPHNSFHNRHHRHHQHHDRHLSQGPPNDSTSLSTPPNNNDITLYSTPSALILWPDLWTDVGKPSPTAGAGSGVVATSQPFGVNPADAVLSLISAKGPVPVYKTLDDYMKGFVPNKSFACLTNQWIRNDAESFSNTSLMDLRNPQQINIQVTITVSNMVGNSVSLASDYQDLALNTITITQNPQYFTIECDQIPVNLQAHITLYAERGKSVFESGAIISVNLSTITGSGMIQQVHSVGSMNFTFDAEMKYASLHDVQDGPYMDFYFRDVVTDTNVLPRADGTACMSPDIQVYGTAPCTDPTGTFLGNNFMTDFTTTNQAAIKENQQNYIYVRGQSPVATSGIVELYAVPNSLITVPSTWQVNPLVIQLDDGNGTKQIPFTCAANGQALLETPFIWLNPPPPPSPSAHYCLFARIHTTNNPNPFTDFTDMADMTNFVLTHANWAWRNIAYMPSKSVQWTTSSPIVYSMASGASASMNLYLSGANLPNNCSASWSGQVITGSTSAPLVFARTSNSDNPRFSWGYDGVLFTPAATSDPTKFDFVAPFAYTYYAATDGSQGPGPLSLKMKLTTPQQVGSPFYLHGRKTSRGVGLAPTVEIGVGSFNTC